MSLQSGRDQLGFRSDTEYAGSMHFYAEQVSGSAGEQPVQPIVVEAADVALPGLATVVVAEQQ